MKISSRAAAAALALSCAFAGTTAVAAPLDSHREAVTIRVSHAGLDLGTAAGRDRFNARVRRAAGYACALRGAAMDLRVDSDRCVEEMVADAAVQIAAIGKRGRVQLATR
ncbi:MAG: UrcA family protein [Sphingomonas taxi]